MDRPAAYLLGVRPPQAMSADHWGAAGPPPETYSRVTNPSRFRDLHDVARSVLAELESDFAVVRREGYGLDPELEKRGLASPTVELIPRDPSGAPLVVAFTDFPGLMVRCGYGLIAAFPACGCDACGETAIAEATRFRDMLSSVTLGRFKEFVSLPVLGRTSYEYKLGEPADCGGRSEFEVSRNHVVVAGQGRTTTWKPWPHRRGASGGLTER